MWSRTHARVRGGWAVVRSGPGQLSPVCSTVSAVSWQWLTSPHCDQGLSRPPVIAAVTSQQGSLLPRPPISAPPPCPSVCSCECECVCVCSCVGGMWRVCTGHHCRVAKGLNRRPGLAATGHQPLAYLIHCTVRARCSTILRPSPALGPHRAPWSPCVCNTVTPVQLQHWASVHTRTVDSGNGRCQKCLLVKARASTGGAARAEATHPYTLVTASQ